jgi:hypothetical protein
MNWTAEHPPARGWYAASTERNPDARRYWNGRRWSAPVDRRDARLLAPLCVPGDRRETLGDRARRTPARIEPGCAIEWLPPAGDR